MLKKILLTIAGIIGILLVAIVAIPFLVNVDQYRPLLVKTANQHIQGELSLGKLSLTLWGQIKIQVSSLDVKDTRGMSIVSVKDAYFHIPFSSVLAGSPELTFKMIAPSIQVVKNSAGQINLTQLAKPRPPGEKPPASAGEDKAEPKKDLVLPSMVTNSRLGLEIRDAKITYRDDTTQVTSNLDGFNFILKDLSITRPIQLEIWSDLGTKTGTGVSMDGTFKMNGSIQVNLAGMALDHVKMNLKTDLSAMNIAYTTLFKKKAGIPLRLNLDASISPDDYRLDALEFAFHNLLLKGKVDVQPVEGTQKATVSGKFETNEVDLASWAGLIPMLTEHELTGKMKLDAAVSGPANQIKYSGKFQISGLTVKAPKLKSRPVLALSIDFSNDLLENILFTMNAPGNDLALKGKVVSFKNPNITLDLQSKLLDLNQLIEFPPKPPKEKSKKKESKSEVADSGKSDGGTQSPAPKAPPVDYDGMLENLRANSQLKGIEILFTGAMGSILADGNKIDDLGFKFRLKDLAANLDFFRLKMYQGQIETRFGIDIKPRAPDYSYAFKIDRLNLDQAIDEQMEEFSNSLKGTLFTNIEGTGKSFNSDLMMKNLKMKGSFKVEKATFQTIDAGKMTLDALNESLNEVAKKVPQLGDRKLKKLPGKEAVYEFISSDFKVEDQTFSAPNFMAKAGPKQGIDISGNTQVKLDETQELKAVWKIIDSQNLTGARDVGVQIQAIKVEHILAQGNEPVQFPVTVGCTLKAPCYDYKEVPGHFAKVAFDNVTGSVKGRYEAELRAKADEAKRRAEEEIRKREEELRARADAERKRLEDEKRRIEDEVRRRADEEKRKAEEQAKKEAEKAVGGQVKKLFGR